MTLADIAYDAGRRGLPCPAYCTVREVRAWEMGQRRRAAEALLAAGHVFPRMHLGVAITADEDARISADGP